MWDMSPISKRVRSEHPLLAVNSFMVVPNVALRYVSTIMHSSSCLMIRAVKKLLARGRWKCLETSSRVFHSGTKSELQSGSNGRSKLQMQWTGGPTRLALQGSSQCVRNKCKVKLDLKLLTSV